MYVTDLCNYRIQKFGEASTPTKATSWGRLDTCQFPTFVHARVQRLKCPAHGIKQLPVPWTEVGSRFTAMFEVLAIDWLQHASVNGVAQQLRISWAEADGIMQRAVRRGLARRTLAAPRHAGVDETSFQKRHEYVTVVSDLERGVVVHVADDRGRAALDGFWASLTAAQRGQVEAVTMDMWEFGRAHASGGRGYPSRTRRRWPAWRKAAA